MQYVSSAERIGLAKGREEGRQEGRQAGRQEGRLEGRLEGVLLGEAKLLRKQPERRFGPLPEWASDKLSSASEQDLEYWGEALLTEPTLDAVFKDSNTH